MDVIAMHEKRGFPMDPNMTFFKAEDSAMRDVGEMREGGFMSAIKREFHDGADEEMQDIRNMVDHSGEFLKNINSNFGLTSPIQPISEMRGAATAYENNLNLTMDLQKLVNEHLMMEDYPAPVDEEMGGMNDHDLPYDMNNDFLGAGDGEEGAFFFDNELGSLIERGGPQAEKRKANKKQVQAIRQAMLKLDKKTQRAAAAQRPVDAGMGGDEDDIVRNMTNLILHKNEAPARPWEKSLMELDTAANSSIMNVLRSTGTASKGFFGGKKLSNLNKDASNLQTLLNPVAESFLTFNLNHTATSNNQLTHANATGITAPQGNFFD